MIESFKIQDNVVIFYIPRKRGKFQGLYECFIDRKNFEKIKDFPWNILYRESMSGFYIGYTKHLGSVDKKQVSKTILLHYEILGIESVNSYHIDHADNNGLNNLESNLRFSTQSENLQNRRTKNKNNQSGYRNVSFVHKHYRIQLQINGKNYMFPNKFNDPKEAGIFAEEMRIKYYGKYAGNT